MSSFTGRKLRQWPCGVGNTSMAEPVDCPEVEKETVRLFEMLRFKGFGSVEFKRDGKDGRYKIMEPTVGRINLQSEVATANGVNLPWMAYAYLAGMERVHRRIVPRPVRWINEFTDLRSGLSQVGKKTLSFSAWLRSYRAPRYYAVFAWNDPAPFLVTTWQILWRNAKRMVFRWRPHGHKGLSHEELL